MELDGQSDGAVPCCKWMELEVEMDGDIQTAALEITPEILRLIAEIDEFKGAWAAIGRSVRPI